MAAVGVIRDSDAVAFAVGGIGAKALELGYVDSIRILRAGSKTRNLTGNVCIAYGYSAASASPCCGGFRGSASCCCIIAFFSSFCAGRTAGSDGNAANDRSVGSTADCCTILSQCR